MAEAQIACPHCRHRFVLPAESFGEELTCTHCSARFVVPAPGHGQAEPVLLSAPTDRHDYSRDQALRQVRYPGLALLLVGLIGLGFNGRLLHLMETEPERLAESAAWLEGIIQPAEGEDGEVDRAPDFRLAQRAAVLFLGMNVVTILAALSLLTLRLYWVALIGSFITTVNFGNCCCAIGAPAALWSIANITDPDVRQHFR